MPLRRLPALALLFAASLPLPLLAAQTQPAPRIPELHSTAFSGDTIDLPQALRGHSAVLIVGFSQSSRDAVTQWSRRLAADYRNSSTVLYYEMPVLAGIPRFLRGAVIGKIKKDVPERAQARFVPILDHEDDWKKAVAYGETQGGQPAGQDDAYLLIVDGAGAIRSRMAAAAPTDQSYAELKRRLESTKP